MCKIFTKIERPCKEQFLPLSSLCTGDVVDALGKQGLIAGVRPIHWKMKFIGPAVTVNGMDLELRKMAIDLAEAGDILVIDAKNITEFACFGDSTARHMKSKGIAGILVNGAIRDARGLIELGFPTFAKAITPVNFVYPQNTAFAGVNIPLLFGNCNIQPGDIIFGDADGAVCIAKKNLSYFNEEYFKNKAEKERMRQKRLECTYDVGKQLEERGYKIYETTYGDCKE